MQIDYNIISSDTNNPEIRVESSDSANLSQINRLNKYYKKLISDNSVSLNIYHPKEEKNAN